MKRGILLALIFAIMGLWAACGGGSSSGNSSGGGQGSGGGSVANSVALSVGPGPADMTNPAGGYANIVFATVTVCQPGTSNCTDIDHMLVDTGSSGLRILASELPVGFTLNSISSGNGTLYECLPFVDSYAWGNVVTADVQMAGEKGSAVPVHLITDAAAPTTCKDTVATSGSAQVKNVNDLGAKGILGVGNFGADCGPYCSTVQKYDLYFACTSTAATSCTQAPAQLAQQVPNPVQMFSSDNNGVVIQMASVANGGAASGSGTMYFGVGTQSNNTPGSGVSAIQLDSKGNFATTYKSKTYTNSYTDTGSNALFFGTMTDKSKLTTSVGITACNLGSTDNPAYFYCPGSELTESATIAPTGTPATTTTVNFSIGNAQSATGYAIGDLAGTNTDADTFDWGLPFFFGRTVYIGLEGSSSSLGTGMYMAF